MKESNNLYKIDKKIIYKVLIFHFLFIILLFFQFKTFKSGKKQNIKINNIIKEPKLKETSFIKDAIKPASIKEKVTDIIEKPKEKKIVNNNKQKVTVIKKPPQKIEKKQIPKKVVKKNISKPDSFENLINKLEKQINKIDDSPNENISDEPPSLDKKEDTLLIPKKIKTLNVDKIIPDIEKQEPSTIKELLIRELQDNLNLPDYGEVKVSFTILPTGEIENVTILDYQSEENQIYLKNSLSELSFKSINKMFNEPQKFIVTFKNE
jgi:hypothetical protein